MAPIGPSVIYEQVLSGDSDIGTISATSLNGQVKIHVEWASETPATLTVTYDAALLFATGVESVMGESALTSMSRSEDTILYQVSGASSDITTLVRVPGTTSGIDATAEVSVSAEGMAPVTHRIAITGS